MSGKKTAISHSRIKRTGLTVKWFLLSYYLEILLLLWLGVWMWLFAGSATVDGNTDDSYGIIGAFYVWPMGFLFGLFGLVYATKSLKRKGISNKVRSVVLTVLSILNMGGLMFLMGYF